MILETMRRDVLRYYCRSYEDRLMAGTSGNASAWSPELELMIITPSGVDWRDLTEESLVLLDLDGNVQSGGRPSSEWPLHAAVYRRVPDARAILHTHSRHATAFAVVGRPIPAVLIEMQIFLGGDVPLCPYAPPGTPELGEKAARILETAPACLLEHHGVVALGKTMEEAWLRASYVEDAAAICCAAAPLGPLRPVPPRKI